VIEAVDTFYTTQFESAGLRYEVNSDIFAQGVMIDGPPGGPSARPIGRSFWIFNTGFSKAEYTRFLVPRDTWFINLWFRSLVAATGPQVQVWRDVEWYRIQDATGTVFSIRLRTDGRIEFKRWDGTVVLTIGPYPVGEWHALQLKLVFDVAHGAWVVKIDGIVVGSDTNVNLTARKPDRFTHRWTASGGLNLAHYVINNAVGPANNDFLPYPWWTWRVAPALDLTSSWASNGPYSRAFAVGDDKSNLYHTWPDGNQTYIQPNFPGALSLFRMGESKCFGRNLAVAATVCAIGLVPDQELSLVVREALTVHPIGAPQALRNWTSPLAQTADLLNYRQYQQISEKSDETGSIWLDGDIERAAWGFQAGNFSMQLRATEFYLERVTTTSPAVSHSCGQLGTYAF